MKNLTESCRLRQRLPLKRFALSAAAALFALSAATAQERDYVQSNKGVIEAFKNRLEKNGINVTIRREMGSDIDGACGQLRKSYIEKSYDPQ